MYLADLQGKEEGQDPLNLKGRAPKASLYRCAPFLGANPGAAAYGPGLGLQIRADGYCPAQDKRRELLRHVILELRDFVAMGCTLGDLPCQRRLQHRAMTRSASN